MEHDALQRLGCVEYTRAQEVLVERNPLRGRFRLEPEAVHVHLGSGFIAAARQHDIRKDILHGRNHGSGANRP
jgi:hypothetical protein